MISGKCIVCEGEKSGYAVREDAVIKAIRAVKQKLNMAKGNTLIVCHSCVEPYKKKRSEFERALVQYGLLGAFLLLLLVVVPLLIGGGFNLGTVATALLLALLIFAFSIFRYYPAADLAGYVAPAAAPQQPQAAQPAPSTALPAQHSAAPKNLLSLFPAKLQPKAPQKSQARKTNAQKRKKKR